MKKRVILLGLMTLLTALFMTVSASAAEVASGECGENLTWVLDDEGTLTISGNGEMDDFFKPPAPWDDYCAYIHKVILPSGLTSIGRNAFSNCTALTTINLPGGLETIGGDAFSGCTRLAFPPIPGTVTSIGGSAFGDCTRLQSVIIPDGVTEIASGTFSGCANLHSVSIPEGVTSIGRRAFDDCTNLTSITLPDSVTTIGESAFAYCDSLISITIPESVTSIEDNTFNWCTNLAFVSIPKSVTSIGEEAFHYCYDLTSITFPATVTFIGDNAFESCHKLSSIYFCGTEAQWKKIVPDDIGDNIFYDYSDIDIHYNSVHITRHPSDVTTTADGSAKFTVAVNGTDFAYQWQYSTDGGETWQNNNCTKATLTIATAGNYRNGYQYRCRITQNGIWAATSQPATLTVAPVAITAHPKSVVTAADGTVSFSVAATGKNLKYQWQFSKDNGATWLNNSCKTATFTIDNPGKSRDGYLYRCKVYNADGSVFSNPAVLTVTAAKLTKPTVTNQPKNVTAFADGTAKFTVAAEGGNLTYQWQYKAPGKGWVNNSCKAATFTINSPQTWRDGYQYRCKVTNSAGTVYSKAAALTITAAETPLTITGQPENVSAKADGTAKFSVTAKGTDLTSQWQYKTPTGKWTNNTCKTATFTINAPGMKRDGYRYRCIVTDADGNIAVSAIALLTVN